MIVTRNVVARFGVASFFQDAHSKWVCYNSGSESAGDDIITYDEDDCDTRWTHYTCVGLADWRRHMYQVNRGSLTISAASAQHTPASRDWPRRFLPVWRPPGHRFRPSTSTQATKDVHFPADTLFVEATARCAEDEVWKESVIGLSSWGGCNLRDILRFLLCRYGPSAAVTGAFDKVVGWLCFVAPASVHWFFCFIRDLAANCI